MIKMNLARWNNLISSFDIGNDVKTYHKLIKYYSESHRFYHTAEHIEDMLMLFDKYIHLIQHKKEVELAIWFHDAVYDIHSKSNELDSAVLADNFLLKHGVAKELIPRIHQLICSTRHDSKLTDNDQKILTDIDLSILGTEKDAFERYEQNIRKEYADIDQQTYMLGRLGILRMFNNREFIYQTKEFRKSYEDKARKNLNRSIKQLQIAIGIK